MNHWQPPHLSTLPSWAGARRIALDTETCDPQLLDLGPGVRRDGRVVGVSFAIENGPAHYLPIGHEGGGNYHDPRLVYSYLRDQARVFKGDLVGANLPYDIDYLAELGIVYTPRFFRDVQVAGPLLEPPEFQMWKPRDDGSGVFPVYDFPKMRLDALAARHGLAGKDERELLEWCDRLGIPHKKVKANIHRMPAHVAAGYAIQDVRLPLTIIDKQERQIDEQDLWTVYDMESRLLPVLVKMRRRGVRVDLSKLDQITDWSREQELTALREVTRLSGVSVTPDDTMSTPSLARVLRKVGVEVPKTDKGNDSVTQPWLDKLDHPVAVPIIRARKVAKIRTTFCQSIRDHEVNGRIHATFNQLRAEREDGTTKGVGFGRLSSSSPNIQQQPARDPEIGPLWRSIYLPDEGGVWTCLDFSQQEPRWLAHYAELVANDPRRYRWPERTRIAAREAAQEYRDDPRTDNHQMFADMCSIKRTPAKELYLGIFYGMGEAKLCHKLGLPTKMGRPDWANGREVEMAGPEGAALLLTFNTKAPHVKGLAWTARKTAARQGYIQTVLGRRLRFPKQPKTGKYDWVHKAISRLIQGSSADQMKQAMLYADDADINIQLQVHDELDLTTYAPAEAEALSEIMRGAVPCNVPHVCDIEEGPDWGHIK